jgi:hypothetical protein
VPELPICLSAGASESLLVSIRLFFNHQQCDNITDELDGRV